MYNHFNEGSGKEAPLIADDVYEIIMEVEHHLFLYNIWMFGSFLSDSKRNDMLQYGLQLAIEKSSIKNNLVPHHSSHSSVIKIYMHMRPASMWDSSRITQVNQFVA